MFITQPVMRKTFNVTSSSYNNHNNNKNSNGHCGGGGGGGGGGDDDDDDDDCDEDDVDDTHEVYDYDKNNNRPRLSITYTVISWFGISIHKHMYLISSGTICSNDCWCVGTAMMYTRHLITYELIDTWFLDSNRRVGVWSLPWRWHILSIPLTTGRGTGAETCGLDDEYPPDDLCSRPEALW